MRKPTWVKIDKQRPKVTVPDTPPPRQLMVRDLEEGTGPPAEEGDEVTIMYFGRYYETGKLFSASWDWGEPTTFKIGAGAEGEGWEEGLKGMRVGGRRELIVPSRMTTPGNVNPDVGALLYVIDLFALAPGA